MKPPNKKQLNDLCKYWQKRLRLQDWKITIELVRAAKMTSKFHDGEIGIIFRSTGGSKSLLGYCQDSDEE